MKRIKSLIALVLCIILCTVLCPAVFAEEGAKITVTNADVMPEDTITLDINIENNPGIMGMAFSIVYDSDAFEYVEHQNGWLNGMTVKDHPDKNCVIFVYVATSNKTNNGKMLSVTFKVKQKAAPGNHKITLGNNNYEKYGNKLHNSFSNSKQEYIVPTVSGGTITVGETCINAGHKYGEWNITKQASCTETGLKNHTCIRDESLCIEEGKYEEVEIPITHDFEDDWTVDEVATAEKDGVMTRHCKKCDATTDRITFTYKEVEDSFPDTSSPSSSDTSDNQQNTPPPINNNSGDKNTLESVENLKDYQENIKPDSNDDQSSTEVDKAPVSDTESSDDDTSSNIEIEVDEPTPPDDSKPFLKTTAGIVTVTLCAALSIGIIVLGVILIIKGKKK